MKANIQDMEIETNPSSLTLPQQRNTERSSIVELIRRWGGLATDALLDSRCQYFRAPHIEGFIGYRMERGCADVYGDPICAPKDILSLAQAFHDFCHTKCHNIIYLTASVTFAKLALSNLCQAIIEYGEEISLDPHFNPKERQGTHASIVRRKLRHAQHAAIDRHAVSMDG